uniref:Uncharacterized protein n=2 Tax=Lotharella globosa TaxID=91324 RepID=A0A7S3YUB5_9EUKA
MAKQSGCSFEPWSDNGDFCYDTVGGCIFSAACFCFVGGSNGDAYAIGDDDEEDDPKQDYKTFTDQEDKDTERHKGWFEICNTAPGSVKASELLKRNESNARVVQMILRVVGWIMMFVGLQLVFEPLLTVLDMIPIIGPIVRFSVSLLAFLFTLLLSFIIIAVAWFSSRPKLVIGAGIVILAIYAVGIWWTNFYAPAASEAAGHG